MPRGSEAWSDGKGAAPAEYFDRAPRKNSAMKDEYIDIEGRRRASSMYQVDIIILVKLFRVNT